MLKRRMNEPAFVAIAPEIRALYDLGCSAMVAFTELSIEQRFGTTFASFKSWYYRLDQHPVSPVRRRRRALSAAPVSPAQFPPAPVVTPASAVRAFSPPLSAPAVANGHLTGSRFDRVFDAAVDEVLHKDKSTLPSSLLDRSP